MVSIYSKVSVVSVVQLGKQRPRAAGESHAHPAFTLAHLPASWPPLTQLAVTLLALVALHLWVVLTLGLALLPVMHMPAYLAHPNAKP